MKTKFFTARYAAIQGSYWAAYCVFYNYAAVFMEDKGFSSTEIGFIFAIGNIFAVLIQPVVASMIDRSKTLTLRKAITILVAIMVAGSVGMYYFQSVKWIVSVLFVVIAMMLQTMQPLASSLALECENYGNKIMFGLARGCGSWSFAIVSLMIGAYLTSHSVRNLPLVYLGIFLFGLIAVYTFRYPDLRAKIKGEDKSTYLDADSNSDTDMQSGIGAFIHRYPKFCRMLIGVVLLYFNHVIINNYLIYIIQNIHGNSSHMGMAMAVAAFCELPAMAMFGKLRKKFSIKGLLIFASVMFSVKHIILLLTQSLTVMIAAHSLQMLGFAIFIPGSIYYVDTLMKKGDAVKGQAYVTMAITTANIFASFFGGMLISHFGVFYMMLIGTIISLIGGIVVILNVEKVD